ncbi:bacteriophage holin (plasmid) [Bacillus licheniformis]|uniref:hypothetical protein n=1 Tax=Bacillus TaxID=1386 RepID=UPI0009B76B78|nr:MULTISPECIES: hypothetical protein [Bacillus]ARC67382.1 bacteriophage holin [Bacillus licheniformis]ARW46209.1 hypothetical protein S100141_04991 [Bacillus licheniformis]MDE1421813.1 hypothetical protein [Bacillus licheniformis]MEC0475818.1 hypothetical protein [Bacillus licheniformis]MEC1657210.1 hypothetical protein [Bacillus haynesii]
MKQETKDKLRTTVFWGALGAAILNVVQAVAVLLGYEISQETIGNLSAVGYSVLSLLVVAGVLVSSNKVETFQAMVSKKKKNEK